MHRDPSGPPSQHAVARLRAERLARSVRPYLARGAASVRCPGCRLSLAHCCCAARPAGPDRPDTQSAFCLLLSRAEVVKTSNTGWLVADVVPRTSAFLWSRTEPDPALLALLADPAHRPFVVFPAEGSPPERVVRSVAPADPSDVRPPLFVILDGAWSEARRMFRSGRALDALPVLAIDTDRPSRYRLRQDARADGLCTAEVAAACLRLAGEDAAADRLTAWFETFVEASLRHRGLVAPAPLPGSSADGGGPETDPDVGDGAG